MSVTLLKRDGLRESLVWRQEQGRLALQTAFLMAVSEKAMESPKYKGRILANIGNVLEVSREILRENGVTELPTLTPVQKQQAIIYAMIGPDFGFLPGFATRQPKDFYIDDRCGATKFPKRAIYKAVEELVKLAREAGLDPSNVPEAPSFHNCGAW